MMNEKDLLAFIDRTVGDPNYQTIVVKGKRIRPGYSKSWISWERILSSGITFENKTACCIGCFIGYFCFRIEEKGAKEIIGYDKNLPALSGARKIGESTSSKCNFEIKDIGKNKLGRRLDIVLALNVLHHIRKDYGNSSYVAGIEDIFESCCEVIFEVNEDELSTISTEAQKNGFTLMKKIVSHRKTQYGNRFILYYKKCSE